LQWDGLDCLQLIDDEIDEAGLHLWAPGQVAELAGMKDQFLQKRGDVDDAAASGKALDQTRTQVECAHGNGSGHHDAVPDAAGNPDGALGGNHPSALGRADRHDSATGVDQLIFMVEMFGDDVAVDEIERKGSDLGGQFWTLWDELARFRHLLSQ